MSTTLARNLFAGPLSDMARSRYGSRSSRAMTLRAGMARQNRIAHRVRKLERGITGKEIKLWDADNTAIQCLDTGSVYMLTGITQGDESLDREGLYINLLSCYLKGQLYTDAANTAVDQLVRIIIFTDKEQHGTVPALSDMLEAVSIYDHKKHENRARFKFYYDKVHSLRKRITANTDVPKKYFEYYKRFKTPIKVHYIGTTGVQASQGKNNLYMAIVSEQGADYPNFSYRCRVRFTD